MQANEVKLLFEYRSLTQRRISASKTDNRV
jgi:hypothetical protein